MWIRWQILCLMYYITRRVCDDSFNLRFPSFQPRKETLSYVLPESLFISVSIGWQGPPLSVSLVRTDKQCCGIVTEWFIVVSVPTLEKFRFRLRIQIRDSTAFQTKIWTKSFLFSDRRWPLIWDFLAFFTFVFHFMLHPDPNPVSEPDTECIPVPVPLRQGSVQQHCWHPTPVPIHRKKYISCDIKSCDHLQNLKPGRVPYLGLETCTFFLQSF